MRPEDLHENAEIVRHKAPKKRDPEFSAGDPLLIDAVTNHFAEHVGEPESVLHEAISDLIHVDVHIIAPSNEHPYYTLFTTGMAERPMNAPEGAEAYRYAELMIKLPEDWRFPIGSEAEELPEAEAERYLWPIGAIKFLARFPHEFDTWLGEMHTVPNGDPPEPFADNTAMCCILLAPPLIESEGFGTVDVGDGRSVHVLQLIPLGPGETEYKLREGADALFELFERMRVSDVVEPGRLDVSGVRPRRRKFLGLF